MLQKTAILSYDNVVFSQGPLSLLVYGPNFLPDVSVHTYPGGVLAELCSRGTILLSQRLK
jgi:hypothetical protein